MAATERSDGRRRSRCLGLSTRSTSLAAVCGRESTPRTTERESKSPQVGATCSYSLELMEAVLDEIGGPLIFRAGERTFFIAPAHVFERLERKHTIIQDEPSHSVRYRTEFLVGLLTEDLERVSSSRTSKTSQSFQAARCPEQKPSVIDDVVLSARS